MKFSKNLQNEISIVNKVQCYVNLGIILLNYVKLGKIVIKFREVQYCLKYCKNEL